MMRVLFRDVYKRSFVWMFPEYKEFPTVLGRWRNVSHGVVDNDTADPGYEAPKTANTVSDDVARLYATWTM